MQYDTSHKHGHKGDNGAGLWLSHTPDPTIYVKTPTSSPARGGQYSAAHAGPSSATSSWPLSHPSGLYSTASTRLPAHADSAASHASCSNKGSVVGVGWWNQHFIVSNRGSP
jgi:hypothetical protein